MKLREAILEAVRRLDRAGIEQGEAVTDARLLAQYALGLSRERLLLDSSKELSPDDYTRFLPIVARRERREPLAYIIGEREFFNLTFVISSSVLVPRPETEFVVEEVLRHIADKPEARVADVGTGSGAIAVAVAFDASDSRVQDASTAHVWATDISAEALAVAQTNAERLRVAVRVTFAQGDLLAPIVNAAPFDVIASNPPYIAVEEIDALQPEVRDWEPRIALGTHIDALHFYRRLANEAPPFLKPGGLLVVEVGQGQAAAVAELWTNAGLTNVQTTRDYAGIERVVSGVNPGPAPK